MNQSPQLRATTPLKHLFERRRQLGLAGGRRHRGQALLLAVMLMIVAALIGSTCAAFIFSADFVPQPAPHGVAGGAISTVPRSV